MKYYTSTNEDFIRYEIMYWRDNNGVVEYYYDNHWVVEITNNREFLLGLVEITEEQLFIELL